MNDTHLPLDQTSYPTGKEDISLEWIAKVLQENKLIKTAKLVSFDVEEIGVGVGFTSVLLKVLLHYDVQEASTPSSLIFKFASNDKEIRSFIFDAGVYEGEYIFFTQVANHVPQVPLPKLYYANLDIQNQHFILVMEDLTPAAVGSDLEGTTFENIKQIVLTIADFHAHWWNKEAMYQFKELRPQNGKLDGGYIKQLYHQGYQKLKEEFGTDYPEYTKACQLLIPFLEKYYAIPLPVFPHTTLAHGDLRLDNVFFPTENGGKFAIIDWATVGPGRGVTDLARLLMIGVKTEDRKKWEPELMKIYHERLKEKGVKKYSFSKCRRDYSEEIISQLILGVIIVGTLDFENERGQALLQETLGRAELIVVDYKIGNLIKMGTIVYSIQGYFHKIKSWF